MTFVNVHPALAVTGHGNGVCRLCVATTSGVGFRVCPSACVPSSPSLAPAMDVETKARSIDRSTQCEGRHVKKAFIHNLANFKVKVKLQAVRILKTMREVEGDDS